MGFLSILIILLAGYLLGSIPVGFLLARAKGIDIRQHGSGNIGATNVFRTLGKGYGIFVFVCDTLKGVFAVILGEQIYIHLHGIGAGAPINPVLAGILGGVAGILGHNFPVWLKFKGGKGVATSLGVVIGLVPLAAVISFAIWAIVLLTSRYVSLASIIAAIAVPVIVAFTASPAEKTPLLVFTCLAALLIVLRHKANIQRLLNGTENRFKKKK
ncbi:MAG: glycerol-3-phosphate 1-O-acyltransferase PlsY [Chthoniobacteraceae bacterium]